MRHVSCKTLYIAVRVGGTLVCVVAAALWRFQNKMHPPSPPPFSVTFSDACNSSPPSPISLLLWPLSLYVNNIPGMKSRANADNPQGEYHKRTSI
jgi:hypothetical protein